MGLHIVCETCVWCDVVCKWKRGSQKRSTTKRNLSIVFVCLMVMEPTALAQHECKWQLKRHYLLFQLYISMVLNALLIYYRLNSYKSQVFVDMYININKLKWSKLLLSLFVFHYSFFFLVCVVCLWSPLRFTRFKVFVI